jgi:hypothetical protein
MGSAQAGALVGKNYFGDIMVNRQRLLWAIATRRQLERWEPLVASFLRANLAKAHFDDPDIWSAQIEHHLALVAARNLVRALDLEPAASVSVDPTLRAELIEGRDLNEHWPENMPLFNVRSRPAQPTHRSGKNFAARNPERGPYWWLAWNNKTGALLLPHVSAPELHQLLDAVEGEVISKDDSLRCFVPPRSPSPWLHENGEWWPKSQR